MSDANRNKTTDPVQFPGYMFSDIHENDNNQYRQLGYPPQNQETWDLPPQNYMTPFNMHASDSQINLQGTPYDFTPHANQVFQDQYEKHLNDDALFAMHVHPNMQTTMSMPDIGVYSPEFKYHNNVYQNIPDNGYLPPHQDMNGGIFNHQPPVQNRTPLIDNLVGNWAPNTNGTYSPFGNVSTSNITNLFTPPTDNNCLNNIKHDLKPANDFQFTRDTRKPRMVAEVKPMRPTYSDVLLKSVPIPTSTKPSKIDVKDTKQKKETKKNMKNEKSQKQNGLNRSNTNNEIKDIPVVDRSNHINKTNEKINKEKSSTLNRKWASLDNVSDTFNHSQSEEVKIKHDETPVNKPNQKNVSRKQSVKNNAEQTPEHVPAYTPCRTAVKKGPKSATKQKNHNTSKNSEQHDSSRRGQRSRKRDCQVPFEVYRQKLVVYLKNWWKFCVGFVFWIFSLISDICSLSWQICRDGLIYMWSWSITHWTIFKDTSIYVVKRVRFFTWVYEKFKKPKEKEEKRPFVRAGLQYNINMPQTGDEAMKRLLACKGKDPYSILGVTSTCSDDDIKRYYKKQAVLVHPDKNKQPGAEEAFKILVHAFDMIGEPERRATYDRGVAESAQVEQAWTELTELLAQFQQKVEAAAKTIRCSYCGNGHKRTRMERPIYAARNCNSCKIFHGAREGDIWAEATCLGFLWNYYACMDGGVYDITDWASCQKNSLKQLKPDSHNVQYRIALGKTSNSSSLKRHSSTGRHSVPPDDPANLENLLNKFYGQTSPDTSQNTRRRNNKKKFK